MTHAQCDTLQKCLTASARPGDALQHSVPAPQGTATPAQTALASHHLLHPAPLSAFYLQSWAAKALHAGTVEVWHPPDLALKRRFVSAADHFALHQGPTERLLPSWLGPLQIAHCRLAMQVHLWRGQADFHLATWLQPGRCWDPCAAMSPQQLMQNMLQQQGAQGPVQSPSLVCQKLQGQLPLHHQLQHVRDDQLRKLLWKLAEPLLWQHLSERLRWDQPRTLL